MPNWQFIAKVSHKSVAETRDTTVKGRQKKRQATTSASGKALPQPTLRKRA